MQRTVLSVALVSTVFLTAAACGQDTTSPPVDDFTRVEPSAVGLNGNQLEQLVSAIQRGRYRNIHSLLIVRYGKLALEEYFNGAAADRTHTLQSVSKSVTSALVGMAIADGTLQGVDELVLDFFPQWRAELEQNQWRAQQRIEDILTMQTGTDYHEGYDGSPHNQLNALATGWDKFWLDRPMVHEPGTFYQYDSGGVIALSAILKHRTGAHADAYAETHLFGPLGITQFRWYRNQEGHPHMGGGLHLLSRDMAKFGQLYLQRGRWGDAQLIAASWVDASFREHVTFQPTRGRFVGYGYLWWILPPDPNGGGEEKVYAASGFRGQYIFVIREHEMVVVVTAGARTGADMNRPIEFLYTDILPAVER